MKVVNTQDIQDGGRNISKHLYALLTKVVRAKGVSCIYETVTRYKPSSM